MGIPVILIICLGFVSFCVNQGWTSKCEISAAECGVSKRCFQSKDAIVSYSLCPYDEGYVRMEIGRTTDAHLQLPQYVAVGFSHNTKMPNAAVSACVWKPGSSPTVTANFNLDNEHNDKPVSDVPDNLYIVNTTCAEDGYFACHFDQKIKPDGNSTEIFALDMPYYLLLAWGNATDDLSLQYHSYDNKLVSTSQVNLTDYSPRQEDYISMKECGVSKGCMYKPENCATDRNTPCEAVVSYAQSLDKQHISFEIGRRRKDQISPSYVAVGFSQEANMEDSAVSACVFQPYQPPTVTANFNGKGDGVHEDHPVKDTPKDLYSIKSTSAEDYFFGCKFDQLINPGGENAELFDLNSSYYLLMAWGTAHEDNTLSYHGADKMISEDRVNLTAHAVQMPSFDCGSLPCKVVYRLHKAHGILMTIGWWFFVALAIMMARYFKSLGGDKKILSEKIWFQGHRLFNVIGLLCIVSALVCVLVAKDGKWIETAFKQHGIMGLVAVIGAMIQPLMALFRCHPEDSQRWIFNLFHRILGSASWIVAGGALYYAHELFNYLGRDSIATGAQVLFGVYVAALLLSVLVLEEPLHLKFTTGGKVRMAVLIAFALLAVIVVIILSTFIATGESI